MTQKEVSVALYTMTERSNEYSETVRTYTYLKDIEMIISYQTGITQINNDTFSTVYTVVGLTNDRSVKVFDKVKVNNKTYLVKSIIDTGRRRMCSLEEEAAIND